MFSLLQLLKYSKTLPKRSLPRLSRGQRVTPRQNKFTFRCLSTTTLQNDTPDPRPYVETPYSYTYGRSNHELLYRTIGDHLDERVANETGAPMVIMHHEGIQKTYTAFNEDVNRIAKSLYEDLGLKRGDVAGLWGCNTYNWLAIQYACSRVGVILCTVNPYYQKGELMYALKKGDIKVLFMPGAGSSQEIVNPFTAILTEGLATDRPARDAEDQLILNHVVTFDGSPFTTPLPGPRPIRTHNLEALKYGKTALLDPAVTSQVTPDDPAVIMFTSGTTGKPKGAFVSHFTVTNNARLCNLSFTRGHGTRISFLVPLPFFHSFAFTFGAIALTAANFQVVVPFLKYNVQELVEAINAHQTTHMMATPTLVIDLMDYLKRERVELPSLQCVISGGASMPVETARQFLEVAPSVRDFRIGYGATELGPASTLSKGWYTFEERIETIGTACDFVELKVIDPVTKQTVKLGETGEILSRGYNTMIGYWKDKVKTAEAIDKAAWYNTGDLGVMDQGGFLKIVGRTKEMIIVGGENVYPREIEELLHTFPGILDAYVIGIPDARKGEEVCAWIKLTDKDTKVTEEELKTFCKDNLAYFKVPKLFVFVDEFPTTSVGKAKKFVMREMTMKKHGLKEN